MRSRSYKVEAEAEARRWHKALWKLGLINPSCSHKVGKITSTHLSKAWRQFFRDDHVYRCDHCQLVAVVAQSGTVWG